MSSDDKLQKVFSLCRYAVRRPKLVFDLLSQSPHYLGGLTFSQRYADSHNGAGATRPDAGPTPPNALRTFFDARKTGRGIWKWLHYFDIYERHFRKFVGREVHVVEIGIYSGGSLEMWKQYFGSRCSIYGVDIEEACRVYENDYTKVFVGDQGDREFWRRFKRQVPAVDILIDDGGHSSEQQIVSIEEMLPHLRPGGVYLCEDIHGLRTGFSSFAQGAVNSLNGMEFADQDRRHKGGIASSEFQAWIASVHFYPYVTVFEKALAPARTLSSEKHGTEWQPFL